MKLTPTVCSTGALSKTRNTSAPVPAILLSDLRVIRMMKGYSEGYGVGNRNFAANNGTATTTWNYDAQRGFLLSEQNAMGSNINI